MEDINEILADKVGVISCGKCCFNCKHASGDVCRLFEITTFQGGYCDRYEEDTKKVKRKTNEAERCNKNWTASNYILENKIPSIKIPFNELIQYLPKTTCERIDEALKAYGQDIQTAVIIREKDEYCSGFYSTWYMQNFIELNGDKKHLEKIVGEYTLDSTRVRNAIVEWLYEMVKKEL